MFQRLPIAALLALVTMVLVTTEGLAEKKPITPTKEIKGTVDDEKLSKDAPTVVVSATGLEKLWKLWKITDKMPEVDFSKELIVLTTSRGSQLKMNLSFDDEIGNLSATTIGTADLRPGFRYLLAVVPKEGVKTVNNKELPKE